jgi:hypothetical protein
MYDMRKKKEDITFTTVPSSLQVLDCGTTFWTLSTMNTTIFSVTKFCNEI